MYFQKKNLFKQILTTPFIYVFISLCVNKSLNIYKLFISINEIKIKNLIQKIKRISKARCYKHFQQFRWERNLVKTNIRVNIKTDNQFIKQL